MSYSRVDNAASRLRVSARCHESGWIVDEFRLAGPATIQLIAHERLADFIRVPGRHVIAGTAAGRFSSRKPDDMRKRLSRCTKKGKQMRTVLTRFVLWVAEYCDRSLITVPDIEE